MNMVMLKILTLQDVFHVLERHKIISDKWQIKKKGKDIKCYTWPRTRPSSIPALFSVLCFVIMII